MKIRNNKLAAMCLILSFSITLASGQTGGDFTITQSVIASGGGQNSTNGTFSLDGTIGQSIAETVPSSGDVFSLRSGFWIAQLAPTAGGASISGRVRVKGASGKGIRNAQLTLTNAAGEVFTTRSGLFGTYRFDEIRVGQSYILTVSAKRFSFAENTRIIMLLDELTDIDFLGAERF